jgi:hypothetical protein
MKEKLVTVGTLVCLFVLTCLLLVHALAIFPGVPAIRWFFVTSAVVLGRLDAPAWVQAIGSVGAILGAAAIAGWQARNARLQQVQSRKDDAIAKAAAVKGILRRVSIVINNAERNIEPNSTAVTLAIEQVELMQATIRRLPVFEIPTAELVFLVQRVDRDLHYVNELLRRFNRAPATDERIAKAKNLIDRVRKRTREAHAACDAMLAGAANAAQTRRL